MKENLENIYGIFVFNEEDEKYFLKNDHYDYSIYEEFLNKYTFDIIEEIIKYVESNLDFIYKSASDKLLNTYNEGWRFDEVYWNGLTISEFYAKYPGEKGDEIEIVETRERLPELTEKDFIKRLYYKGIVFDYNEDDPYEYPVQVYINTVNDLFTEHSISVSLNIKNEIMSVGLA
ncbi:hypothetical protein LNTAR_19377 [Lentisphaera araneosa HTCC2155]|uniref:DUF2262 domain-containing protein n=1 Tax=Lentisphaera araneosa HTCC2155 TaxID=313628 RepID=A6DQU1_9BACT|nr:DUF2262 domain-containing protein [Lentisphaera araneosa]EDM25991.1 hypothetical protein LNTAR_19377 [Lentisphaera araneosa HTCC2155]